MKTQSYPAVREQGNGRTAHRPNAHSIAASGEAVLRSIVAVHWQAKPLREASKPLSGFDASRSGFACQWTATMLLRTASPLAAIEWALGRCAVRPLPCSLTAG